MDGGDLQNLPDMCLPSLQFFCFLLLSLQGVSKGRLALEVSGWGRESYASCASGFIGPINQTTSLFTVEASRSSFLPLQLATLYWKLTRSLPLLFDCACAWDSAVGAWGSTENCCKACVLMVYGSMQYFGHSKARSMGKPYHLLSWISAYLIGQ